MQKIKKSWRYGGVVMTTFGKQRASSDIIRARADTDDVRIHSLHSWSLKDRTCRYVFNDYWLSVECWSRPFRWRGNGGGSCSRQISFCFRGGNVMCIRLMLYSCVVWCWAGWAYDRVLDRAVLAGLCCCSAVVWYRVRQLARLR